MSQRHDLAGRSVVITGAARGIGVATAERLAAPGARGRDGRPRRRPRARAWPSVSARRRRRTLDVTDPESWASSWPRSAERRSGRRARQQRRDHAARLGAQGARRGGANDHRRQRARRSSTAPRPSAPGMVDRGRGHIINVASAVGRIAVADGATYSASKFAAVGFSEATRAELAPLGIDVTRGAADRRADRAGRRRTRCARGEAGDRPGRRRGDRLRDPSTARRAVGADLGAADDQGRRPAPRRRAGGDRAGVQGRPGARRRRRRGPRRRTRHAPGADYSPGRTSPLSYAATTACTRSRTPELGEQPGDVGLHRRLGDEQPAAISALDSPRPKRSGPRARAR